MKRKQFMKGMQQIAQEGAILSLIHISLLLIPGCFLGGAIITLFCDGFARTVFAPTELSISSVTAVFLVPVVIVMMLRRNEDR